MPLPLSPDPLLQLDSSQTRQIRFKMKLPDSPSFSPPLMQPTTTYHTNTLNLFQGETEQPIFSGQAPTLTNLVPPDPEHEPASDFLASGPSRPLLQDFDRVGGWDEAGAYQDHGHIEEVADDASESVLHILNPLPSSSRLHSPLPLPANAQPPPRPHQRPYEIRPESPATLQNRLRNMLSDDPSRHSSPLARSWTTRNLGFHSVEPSGTLSPLNVFEPSRVSTPIQQPFVIPPDGVEGLPTIPSIETGTSPPVGQDEDEPVIRPIRISRSPTPPPPPPPKDDPPVPVHPYSPGPNPKLRLKQQQQRQQPRAQSRDRHQQRDQPQPQNQNHLQEQRQVPVAPQKVKDETFPLPSPTTTAKLEAQISFNDETIIEQNLCSIEDLSIVVRSISKEFSLHDPATTTTTRKSPHSHIEACERVIDSLSQVEKALVRRRDVPEEYWEHFPPSSRCRYERRLRSLERSLRRLRSMSEHILEGQYRLLEVVVDKFARHHAKLQDVADKLNATFDRLKLRHLHKIASKHVAQANVCRSEYLDAREVYFGRRGMETRTGNS
ncbi:hypothetical protein VKT23_000377 [Stygiomarasmius scandens]|uniref:Uncharacterized protein n=1 Tax=Marasmiellus scandens TaxID=2682957 RepID=A0ABR1K3X1_9AGAR